MCIRDSPRASTAAANIGTPKPKRESRPPMTGPKMKPSPNACLLYTSDAADDLLCVDLGGRRIIKKKNQL